MHRGPTYPGSMLTLINTNRMTPPIAPVGLDYVAMALRQAGEEVELVDLALADDPEETLSRHFANHQPELVGLTLRNVDDCFWPRTAWFLPELEQTISQIRRQTDAPVVLGGVGFSIFAEEILARGQVDFGIRGDGEHTLVQLLEALRGRRRLDRVHGLVWQEDGQVSANSPAWPEVLEVPTDRDVVDNAGYFRLGGQIGLETKRGCPRRCAYCADPLAKGSRARLRDPVDVAREFASLARRGIDVIHLCDAEFNLPYDHARDVCDALIDRGLGETVRWYAYLAVQPFDDALARRMARAGCVGINFTSDAAHPAMLAAYGQPHREKDLLEVVRLCREHRMAVMLDMLLGGPGETPQTLAHTIQAFKRIDPDCAGAALGVRLYPGTAITARLATEGPLEQNPGLRRRYEGPIDLLRPTFYIAPALGPRPAERVNDLLAGDPRFFGPEDETPVETGSPGDHNYNANQALTDAIASGARGAYWDILRRLRQ